MLTLPHYVHFVFASPSDQPIQTSQMWLLWLLMGYKWLRTCPSLHLLLILPHYVHSVFTSPSPHTTTLRTLCVHSTFSSYYHTTYTLCSLHLLLELCSELCDLSGGLLPETAQLVLQPLLPLHCPGLGLHQGWGLGGGGEVGGVAGGGGRGKALP